MPLPAGERNRIQQFMARRVRPVTWSKQDILAAADAVEAILNGPGLRTRIQAAIEAAAPLKFNNAQKKKIRALVMQQQFPLDLEGP